MTEFMNWPETTVKSVAGQVKQSEVYRQMLVKLQNLIIDPEVTCDSLEEDINYFLSDSGYRQKLHNEVYQCIVKNPNFSLYNPQRKEPIDYIRKAQIAWKQKNSKWLGTISKELGKGFSQEREISEKEELKRKWCELSSVEMDFVSYRPLYAPKSVLVALINVNDRLNTAGIATENVTAIENATENVAAIENATENVAAIENATTTAVRNSIATENSVRSVTENFVSKTTESFAVNESGCIVNAEPGSSTDTEMLGLNWGLIKVPLKVKSLHEFRLQFEEMSGNIDHLGLHVTMPFLKWKKSEKYLKQRMTLGKYLLEENKVATAREFCKRGCPSFLRAEIWSLILGINVSKIHKSHFNDLKNCVFQNELLVDKLIFKDIRVVATNDDQYFIFEDLLYQILLPFIRDTSVASQCDMSNENSPNLASQASCKSKSYPGSGIFPFHGFSLYLAPLCFIYRDPATLYYVFRELYIRYFSRLHNLSSHSHGVLSLALSFETLLRETEPQMTYLFSQRGIYPLRIAINWIVKAFSGYLPSDQILQLWDCILAYDTTEVLAVLAVGIISLRKPVILHAKDQKTLIKMLDDITEIRVIPILHGMCNQRVTTTGMHWPRETGIGKPSAWRGPVRKGSKGRHSRRSKPTKSKLPKPAKSKLDQANNFNLATPVKTVKLDKPVNLNKLIKLTNPANPSKADKLLSNINTAKATKIKVVKENASKPTKGDVGKSTIGYAGKQIEGEVDKPTEIKLSKDKEVSLSEAKVTNTKEIVSPFKTKGNKTNKINLLTAKVAKAKQISILKATGDKPKAERIPFHPPVSFLSLSEVTGAKPKRISFDPTVPFLSLSKVAGAKPKEVSSSKPKGSKAKEVNPSKTKVIKALKVYPLKAKRARAKDIPFHVISVTHLSSSKPTEDKGKEVKSDGSKPVKKGDGAHKTRK